MAANYARMGFVGFVKLLPETTGGSEVLVRVTSADVKLTQEISYPDLVDGKVDQTVYQLGPQQVGGNLAFPLLHEFTPSIPNKIGGPTSPTSCGDATGGASLAKTLWTYAAQRNDQGRMNNQFSTLIRYADNLAYTYKGCLVNSMTFTINQSEPVNVSCEVIGGANGGDLRSIFTSTSGSGFSDSTAKMLSPARVITWNDAVVRAWGNEDGATSLMVDSSQVREFTATINNNIERFYSLNGVLGPVDVAAKKRELSGTLKTMGANYQLTKNAQSNQDNFTSKSALAFGYKLGNAGGMYWATALYGVVFEIEEISLSTGLFETTTKWRALGDCENDHLATRLGTSLPTTDLPRPHDNVAVYGDKPNNALVFQPFQV